MTKHYNDPSAFTELRLEPLKQYAKSWVKAYPDLSFKQISLHSQPLGQTETERKFLFHLKYVLVFEISNCQHVDFSNLDTYPTKDDDPCVRSLKEIIHMDQFANPQVGQNWHRLFNSRFPGAVYKQPPGEGFHREWRSVLKQPDEKLDRFVDDEPFWVLYPESPAKFAKDEQKCKTLICPPGTSWKQIKITLVEEDKVEIKTPTFRGRFSYRDLGMSDGRTPDKNKPTAPWVLLKTFAKNQGFISRKNTNYDPTLPDTVKRLNTHLQSIFIIQDSRFVSHYKKEKGYRAKIFFSDKTIVK